MAMGQWYNIPEFGCHMGNVELTHRNDKIAVCMVVNAEVNLSVKEKEIGDAQDRSPIVGSVCFRLRGQP